MRFTPSFFLPLLKYALLKNHNIHLISLSQEMYDFTKDVDYLREKPNRIIPNSVDTKLFKLLDRYKSRDDLGLPQEKIILLFVSDMLKLSARGSIY